MGFSLDGARRKFENGVVEFIEKAKDYSSKYTLEAEELKDAPIFNPFNPKAVSFFENYTFDLWSKLIKEIFDKKLRRISSDDKVTIKNLNPYLHYILEWRFDDNDVLGFPGYGDMYMYRAMVEVVDPNDPVILEFSSLVDWVEPENYTCNPPKSVIMTEGTTDKRILEETLKILYPHLVSYYKFIDFDLANMQGSSGHLLNIIKAFVATGVQHRTIAIFDNDTAGLDALRQLANVPLPDNIKVIPLPYLPIAAKYPTNGAQGNIEIDINGLACSLELYLGRDVLEDSTQQLTPVRWGGYMQGMRQYQGELINKSGIQERYFQILREVSTNPTLIQTHDWSGMHLVFEAIFAAFNNQPLFEFQ